MRKTIVLLIMSLFIPTLVFAAWTHTPPIHYYKFDNNLFDTNASKTLNLTFYNGTAYYPTGKLNQALNFTNSRQNYAYTGSYELMDNISTISFWFMFPENLTQEKYFFSIGDSINNYVPDSIYCGISALEKVYCARFYNTPLDFEITGSSTLQTNTWYHWVMIFGTGGTRIYINDALEGSHASVNPFNSDNVHLKIGRRYDYDPAYYYNGMIDNFALFGYRFTSQQINDSYNAGSGVEYVVSATPSTVSLNLSVTQPYNNTGYYLNPVRFNMSVNSSYNFNCNLYINGGNMTASYLGRNYYLWDVITNSSTTSIQNVDGGDWTNYSNILDSLNTTFSTPKYSSSNYGYLYLNFTEVGVYINNVIQIKLGSNIYNVTLPVGCVINNSWSYIKFSAYTGATNNWGNLSCLDTSGAFNNNFWNANDPVLDTVANLYSIYIFSRNNTHNSSYSSGSGKFVEEVIYFPRYYQSLLNYSFRCDNGVDNVNTSNVTIMVDLVTPSIYTTFSNNLSFGISWLTGQINLSDPNLYGYNLSIDGILWMNTSGISSYLYQINFSSNISNLSVGFHNLSVCVFDGHTSKEIEVFSNIKDNSKKELKYLFYNGEVSIYPEVPDEYTDFSTEKLKDKYTFTYLNSKKGKKDVVFYVKSSAYIDIPKKSEYKGHVIIPSLTKWVDFETEGGKETIVERINDNVIKITIIGLDKDVIKFSSIGNLNVLCRTYVFDRINLTDNTFSSFTEKSNGVFNITFNYSGTYTINVTLNYNNTNYAASTSDGYRYNTSVSISDALNYSDTSKVYYWNFTINNSLTYNNRTPSSNATLYMMWFGSCGGISNNTAFNFSFFDESNTTLESMARMSGLIQIYKYSTFNRNYSIILTIEKHDQIICLYPWYESYNVSGYLDYVNTTSTTKRFIINVSVSNVSRAVTLYLIANESAIPVIMTVIDKDGFPIGGVQVKIDRYYPTTGAYLEIDSLTTDFQGQARMLVTLYNVEYRFRFEYPIGTFISSTSKAYLISQSLTYQLIMGDEYFAHLTQSINVLANLTWSNYSESFVYDYIDVSNTVLYGCLHVYKVGGSGKTKQNSSCLVWANGRINISFTPDNNTQYDAEAYVCYPDRCDLVASASGYRLVVPSSFGKSGLLLVLLLTMVIACGFIFNASITAILLPVPLMIGVFINIVNLPPYVAIMLFLFGLTMAIIINLRSST
jgi:hypothetical protein